MNRGRNVQHIKKLYRIASETETKLIVPFPLSFVRFGALQV